MNELGKQLADLQAPRGGNIIMVQVENEYGAYAEDKEYIASIRDIVRGAGFTDVPLFQCDWASTFQRNGLDDLLWTINFGTGADIDQQFKLFGKPGLKLRSCAANTGADGLTTGDASTKPARLT